MTNELIDEIYNNFSASDRYYDSEEAKRLSEIQSAQGEAIKEAVGRKAYIQSIDGLVATSETQSERYGFIMGFKYAMRLMSECSINKTTV